MTCPDHSEPNGVRATFRFLTKFDVPALWCFVILTNSIFRSES